MDRFSSLYGANTSYLEEIFTNFKNDPESVPLEWRTFFQSVDSGYQMVASSSEGGSVANGKQLSGSQLSKGVQKLVADNYSSASAYSDEDTNSLSAQSMVSWLIHLHRDNGHQFANTNPLEPKEYNQAEILSQVGLAVENLNDEFATNGLLATPTAKLSEILEVLKNTYAGKIGVQYSHMPNRVERGWLRRKMEPIQNSPSYSMAERKQLLKMLMEAESFEQFLHTKYIGVKRFSVEGGDALIPMLDTLIDSAGKLGVEDIVMGMSHRGRLNVLANILRKPFVEIFAAFNHTDKNSQTAFSGDVKYHMGTSYDVVTHSGDNLHISLLNNPSHLEAVDPVVEGSCRAKQTKKGADGYKKVLPVQIHGDSAFAGQGVVTETLNLANLAGYSTGGTIHLVVNNQVGFTANPEDVFSGEYCTDVARMLQVPIFHVNGDDVEACKHVMQMAMEWRNEFHKDVVIDIVCYRRYGHNEGDDPSFTQPLMYKEIKGHKTPYSIYKEKLLAEKVATEKEIADLTGSYQKVLQNAFEVAKKDTAVELDMFKGEWQNFARKGEQEPKTSVTKKFLGELAESLTTFPSDFTPNKKVAKIMQRRAEMLQDKAKGMDWGAAEMAAYASLLKDDFSVRISGQDVKRGTFSHRHVVMMDSENGKSHLPIKRFMKDEKNNFIEVWNSSLSEEAVLGFEFGYSLANPKVLPVWEAQFGDFANGAQIIIDQFITSSETKWGRLSGLVMLLPHGYEGQGAEHSSARLERYLQLCAEDNITVVNLTTPAQIFHALRRQMLRSTRKPLIVMSPKSLLRNPQAVSTVEDLTEGGYQKVIDDGNVQVNKVKKILFCSGKIYYDLLNYQQENNIKNTAIIRLEQLYPLAEKEIVAIVKRYKNVEDYMWVQEEPRNQGAWTYILDNLEELIGWQLSYVGRERSATTAVGDAHRHAKEQEQIVKTAFVG